MEVSVGERRQAVNPFGLHLGPPHRGVGYPQGNKFLEQTVQESDALPFAKIEKNTHHL